MIDQLFTPPESPVCNPDVRAEILREIRTMGCEVEAERKHIQAELFMNQTTGDQ